MPRQALGSRLNAASVDVLDEAEEEPDAEAEMPDFINDEEAGIAKEVETSPPAMDEEFPMETEDLQLSPPAQESAARQSRGFVNPEEASQPLTRTSPEDAAESGLETTVTAAEQTAEVSIQSPFAASGPEFEQSEADQLECLEKLPSELLADPPQPEESMQTVVQKAERAYGKGLSRFAPEPCPSPQRSTSLKLAPPSGFKSDSSTDPDAALARPELSQQAAEDKAAATLSSEGDLIQEDSEQATDPAEEEASVVAVETSGAADRASQSIKEEPVSEVLSKGATSPEAMPQQQTAAEQKQSSNGASLDNAAASDTGVSASLRPRLSSALQQSVPQPGTEAQASRQQRDMPSEKPTGAAHSANVRCSLDDDTAVELAALSVPTSATDNPSDITGSLKGQSLAEIETRLANLPISEHDSDSFEVPLRQPAAMVQEKDRWVFFTSPPL